MAGTLLPLAKQIALDNSANPGSGFKFCTYEPGTLTPKVTYQDAAMSIPNELEVEANARGEVTMYGEGLFRIILKDAAGVTIWDRDNVGAQDFSGNNGADLIGFLQSGTGAKKRSIQSKARDVISVRDYIDTAIDGTTSNQAGIVAAVAAAYAAGAELFWPAGTYVSSATIPNFHDIRHTGPGLLKRGSDAFYPQPHKSLTNRIYLATTGSADNDGLSPGEPFATFQQAFDAVSNYGPQLDGYWEIVAAAGTYAISAGQQTFSTPSRNRVVIRGPAVGGHPNVPTCIIDGTGGATYQHGLSAGGIGVRVEFRDIKAQNFNEATAATTRIGFVGENEADVYWNNCHTAACDWTGIYAFNTVRARIRGGIHDGNTDGLIVNCAEATIGYLATSTANGPIIKNSVQSGIYWSRGAQGHIDNCTIQDCGVGLLVAENSRVDAVANDFKRNTVGVRTRTGGVFGDAGNVFNYGTADANTTAIDYRAYSGESFEFQNAFSEYRVARDRATYTHTGTTAKTAISTPYTVKAQRIASVDTKVRVKVHGIFTTITAGTQVILDLGGTAVSTLQVTTTTAGGFTADFEIFPGGVASQRVTGILMQNFSSPRTSNGSFSISNTADLPLVVSLVLGAASDSVTINRIEVFLMG